MRRSEIVLGKWLAYVGVTAAYVLGLAGGVLVVARGIGHYTPPGAHVGLPLMVFEVTLLVTLSIWGGSPAGTAPASSSGTCGRRARK